MDWKEAILPLLLAAIAATPGILALLKGRNKEKADTAATYIDSAKDLLEEYRAKIKEVEDSYKVRLNEIEDSYKAKLNEIEATVAEQAEIIKCQERKIAKQQVEIDRLRVEQDDFFNGVTALCAQIRGLGHEPVWEPEK